MWLTNSSAKTAMDLISERPTDHLTLGKKSTVLKLTRSPRPDLITRQQRKNSKAEECKSAIAKHAAIENHMLDWENTKKLEQVPHWRMREIKEAIAIMSTPHNFNKSQVERHILPHVWDSLLSMVETVNCKL